MRIIRETRSDRKERMIFRLLADENDFTSGFG
jgi:hypothetical protein